MTTHLIARFRLALFYLVSMLVGATAVSADAYVEAVPIHWRLQNYISNVVVIYYAGTPCTSGSLTFPAGATTDDKNRLWSLVIAANTAGKVVGVYYETTTGTCQMTSFILKEAP